MASNIMKRERKRHLINMRMPLYAHSSPNALTHGVPPSGAGRARQLGRRTGSSGGRPGAIRNRAIFYRICFGLQQEDPQLGDAWLGLFSRPMHYHGISARPSMSQGWMLVLLILTMARLALHDPSSGKKKERIGEASAECGNSNPQT